MKRVLEKSVLSKILAKAVSVLNKTVLCMCLVVANTPAAFAWIEDGMVGGHAAYRSNLRPQRRSGLSVRREDGMADGWARSGRNSHGRRSVPQNQIGPNAEGATLDMFPELDPRRGGSKGSRCKQGIRAVGQIHPSQVGPGRHPKF